MDNSGPSPAMRFGCASTAACIAEAITFPMEAIIIRMQIQTGTSLGMVGMLSSMVKHEGVGVLWRGVSPAMWRQVLCGGVGVGLYPVVRGSLVPEGGELQLYHRIIAGSTTGSFAQFLAQPLDVIKVRLQADAKLVASGAKPQYRGMVDTAAKIWATEGASGFFLGLAPSLFRAAAQYVNVFSLSHLTFHLLVLIIFTHSFSFTGTVLASLRTISRKQCSYATQGLGTTCRRTLLRPLCPDSAPPLRGRQAMC